MIRKKLLTIFFFFIFSGMKIILKDGNFIEVSDYRIFDNFIRAEIKRQKLDIPLYLVDLVSTMRLADLERRGFSILKNYTSFFYIGHENKSYNLSENSYIEEKKERSSPPRIKLETRKETNPFFMELPDQKLKDEDFIEKIKRRGIFLKLHIPVEE